MFYGGSHTFFVFDDTWEWDGTSWTLIAITGPGPRYSPVRAYDPANQVVVLYGGSTNSNGTSNFTDTWTYDGTSWTQVATVGPPGRVIPQMVYDSEREKMVLFGGPTTGAGTTILSDTWEWDGTSWTEVTSNAPTPPHVFHVMAYHQPTNSTILFGGSDGTDLLGDTWAYGVGTDCNGNGVPDSCDIANGTSQDCNGNGVPDSCDIASGRSQDCNGNGVPNSCDITNGTSQDCNGNSVPDSCDIANGTSLDLNGNGIPDECDVASSAPQAATGYPNGALKNRYVSFVPHPATIGIPHTYKITHAGSGKIFFISPPRTTPTEIAGLGYTFVVADPDPVAAGLLFDYGTLPIVHVGGCLIAPGETYEVRATTDGVIFSAPLTVTTAAIPTNGRLWGDAVGVFSTSGDPSTIPPTPAGAWTPPNGIMNGLDIVAAVRGFQKMDQPDNTWTDINGLSQDRLTNGNDILRFVNAFSVGSGKEFYPFPTPATCTAGPGMDIPPEAELAP